MRTAAAGKTLEQLNSERDEFLAEVMQLVTEDLRSNGLILESVTISRLDQTDEQFLKEENIFDAQGRRKIAEITQLNLTERTRLLRKARKRQDVETVERVLQMEQMRSEAEARQRAEIAKIEAITTARRRKRPSPRSASSSWRRSKRPGLSRLQPANKSRRSRSPSG